MVLAPTVGCWEQRHLLVLFYPALPCRVVYSCSYPVVDMEFKVSSEYDAIRVHDSFVPVFRFTCLPCDVLRPNVFQVEARRDCADRQASTRQGTEDGHRWGRGRRLDSHADRAREARKG